MVIFLQLVIAGVALGSAYALVALGFSIIYKATSVIDFAQGEFLLLGAFLVANAKIVFQWNFFVALLFALVVTVLVSRALRALRVATHDSPAGFRHSDDHHRPANPHAELLFLGFGPDRRCPMVPPFSSTGADSLGNAITTRGVRIGLTQIVMIVVTGVLVGLLFLFFQHTKYGLAMRATSQDQEAALAMGINVRRVNALAWGIAAIVATVGSMLFTFNQFGRLDNTLDTAALLAFPAMHPGAASIRLPAPSSGAW